MAGDREFPRAGTGVLVALRAGGNLHAIHFYTLRARMTTPEIPVPLFLQAVRRRPEVWTPTGPEQTDTKRAAAAWKQICRSTWPEFDSWTVEQKRTRCLILQKKWQTLQKDFMNGHKNKNSARKSVHHDLLAFLVADKKPSAGEEGEGSLPAKRSRLEEEELFPDEDRHFLLSLESHMRDVPRGSKLALREDMLRLVRKYTDRTRPAAPSTSDTHSQEY